MFNMLFLQRDGKFWHEPSAEDISFSLADHNSKVTLKDWLYTEILTNVYFIVTY